MSMTVWYFVDGSTAAPQPGWKDLALQWLFMKDARRMLEGWGCDIEGAPLEA
jgi:hypothetical protein